MISKKKMGLLAAVGLFSLQAYAYTAEGWYAEYYSDDTYTEVVGEGMFSCQNRLTIWGTRTEHSRIISTWKC